MPYSPYSCLLQLQPSHVNSIIAKQSKKKVATCRSKLKFPRWQLATKNKLAKRNIRKNLHSLLALEHIRGRGKGKGHIIIIVLNYQGQRQQATLRTLANQEKFAEKRMFC